MFVEVDYMHLHDLEATEVGARFDVTEVTEKVSTNVCVGELLGRAAIGCQDLN